MHILHFTRKLDRQGKMLDELCFVKDVEAKSILLLPLKKIKQS